MKRTFEIEFPDDLGPLWMNRDNLLLCLTAYCRNTRFVVRDVTDDGCTTDPAIGEAGPGVVFRYDDSTGALLCETEIDGLTQTLHDDNARGYGGRYFVAETLSRSAAEKIAAALGGRLQ